MAYQKKTSEAIMAAPLTLGSRLGRRAVVLGVTVNEIATMTGATRKTIYSWFVGGWVAVYYKERVEKVLNILKEVETREEALKRAKRSLNVHL